jgi:hypothetical protein
MIRVFDFIFSFFGILLMSPINGVFFDNYFIDISIPENFNRDQTELKLNS